MLGYDTYLRCVMAVWMARQVKYRYIVVTGAWGLSQSMERFLISQGVPKELILQENAAESTHENAVFTKRILARVYGGNLPRIVVLTSDFHSRRALLTFQRAGFIHCSAIPAPDVIKRCSTRAYRLHGAETVAIELFALAYYKLKGYA
jgi:uncharacterized SAM-binding protein YcdF (DUF218 family)